MAAAAAEGLELVPSSNETGFKCVAKNKAKYEAVTRENGKTHRLGTFVTPEEAALCYARYIGAERAAAEAAEARGEGPQLLTVDEARAAAAAALAAAAAEGLELVPSSRSNETGFKGVRRQRSGKYTAEVWENGKQNHLGSFTTPEKAALCIARYIGAERAAAEAAMVRAGKARAAAAAEGLEPPRSATGFEDTHETGEGMHEAKVKENGKLRYSAGTTYIPLTFHLPSTYLPLTFHLPSTYLPLTFHLRQVPLTFRANSSSLEHASRHSLGLWTLRPGGQAPSHSCGPMVTWTCSTTMATSRLGSRGGACALGAPSRAASQQPGVRHLLQ